MSVEWNLDMSKLGENSVLTVESLLQNLVFIITKASFLISTQKLGLKMWIQDAPLIQIAANNTFVE